VQLLIKGTLPQLYLNPAHPTPDQVIHSTPDAARKVWVTGPRRRRIAYAPARLTAPGPRPILALTWTPMIAWNGSSNESRRSKD